MIYFSEGANFFTHPVEFYTFSSEKYTINITFGTTKASVPRNRAKRYSNGIFLIWHINKIVEKVELTIDRTAFAVNWFERMRDTSTQVRASVRRTRGGAKPYKSDRSVRQ